MFRSAIPGFCSAVRSVCSSNEISRNCFVLSRKAKYMTFHLSMPYIWWVPYQFFFIQTCLFLLWERFGKGGIQYLGHLTKEPISFSSQLINSIALRFFLQRISKSLSHFSLTPASGAISSFARYLLSLQVSESALCCEVPYIFAVWSSYLERALNLLVSLSRVSGGTVQLGYSNRQMQSPFQALFPLMDWVLPGPRLVSFYIDKCISLYMFGVRDVGFWVQGLHRPSCVTTFSYRSVLFPVPYVLFHFLLILLHLNNQKWVGLVLQFRIVCWIS